MSVRRLILFDVDGTLISPGPIPRETLAAALSAELGRPVTLEFEHVAGSTDPVIVREALLRHGNGQPVEPEVIASVLERYLREVEIKLAYSGSVSVFAGVRELAQACREAGWARASARICPRIRSTTTWSWAPGHSVARISRWV